MRLRARALALSLVLPGLALAASGCQTGPVIGSESNREVDLTRFRTYALLPLPERIEDADPGVMLRISRPLQEEIHAGMLRLGYAEAPEKEADVVLSVRGKVVPRVDVTDWGYNYHGYGHWGSHYGPSGVSVREYQEGTLAIEAFPRASKTLAWVGWAKDRVDEEVDEPRLRKAVQDILARFPPAKR